MNNKTRLKFKLIFGVILIAGSVFFAIRYLMKGSPFIKVMGVGLIAAVTYLVIGYIKKTTKK